MSIQAAEPAKVPQWDLADRMSKALRESGIGVTEMAGYLGMTRESIGRWINGRGEPKRAALVAWAAITNVDLEWLETGVCAIRDSNPEPADLEPRLPRGRHLRAVDSAVRKTLTPEFRAAPARTRVLWSVS